MGILNRIKKNKDEDQKPQDKIQATESTPKQEKQEVQKISAGSRAVASENVIVKPLISEKAATLAGANQYVFVVRKDANRIQVRTAIKQMYNVSPLSVNILNVQGKKMRFGRRRGKRSDWKKAIITLPEGQRINVYEGV